MEHALSDNAIVRQLYLGLTLRRSASVTQKPPQPVDLAAAYTFLEDGGAALVVPGGDQFWRSIMTGPPFTPEVDRVVHGSGWLAARYVITSDSMAWERHPNGSELLVMLSGAMDIVFDMDSDHIRVGLTAGNAILVPAAIWHRQLVRTAGAYLGVTYGRGTEHRAL